MAAASLMSIASANVRRTGQFLPPSRLWGHCAASVRIGMEAGPDIIRSDDGISPFRESETGPMHAAY